MYVRIAYPHHAKVTEALFSGFSLIPNMKFLISFILLIPSNTLSSTELFAKRLEYLDPTGAQKDFVPETVIDSYNSRVPSPGNTLAGDTLYDTILYTVLCGISTNSVSYGSQNVCLPLKDQTYHQAKSVLERIRSLAYPSVDPALHRAVIPPNRRKPPSRVKHSFDLPHRHGEISTWIERMRKNNGAIGVTKAVGFDEIAQAWNGMLALNLSHFPDVMNKVLVQALAIFNEPAVTALIPEYEPVRSEIRKQFCIILRSFYRTENWVRECNDTPPPSKEELVAAEHSLQNIFKSGNLRREIRYN